MHPFAACVSDKFRRFVIQIFAMNVGVKRNWSRLALDMSQAINLCEAEG